MGAQVAATLDPNGEALVLVGTNAKVEGVRAVSAPLGAGSQIGAAGLARAQSMIDEDSPPGEEVSVLEQVADAHALEAVRVNLNVEEGMQREFQACTGGMTSQEVVAFGKLKWFYNALVRKLAPPLLMEAQSALRPEAEPYTPRRMTRGSKCAPVTKPTKATQAENVLMRALGLVPEDLEGNKDNVAELAELFDSPLREQHIQVIAALFGKEVPSECDMTTGTTVVVGAA